MFVCCLVLLILYIMDSSSGLLVLVSFTNAEELEAVRVRLPLRANELDVRSVLTTDSLGFDLPRDVEKIEWYNHLTAHYEVADCTVPVSEQQQVVRIAVTLKRDSVPPFPRAMLSGRLFESVPPIQGEAILIAEDGSGRAEEGTGLVIWDASVVLAKTLEHNKDRWCSKEKRVIELGAGTGLAGLSAAALGAGRVVLTDLHYALPNLQRNVDSNSIAGRFSGGTEVSVAELDWSNRDTWTNDRFDVILAADVVWVENLIPKFVSALKHVADGSNIVLFAHRSRTTRADALLFSELQAAGFELRALNATEMHPEYSSPSIIVYEMSLKTMRLPPGFCYLDEVDADILVSLRYETSENFCGTQIDGYAGRGNRAIMTCDAAAALHAVQQDVHKDGFSLVVYDAYRPQRAVDHFIRWSLDGVTDHSVKAKYYPNIEDKSRLFELGFLAKRSGHSRGSTVDLTLVELASSGNLRLVTDDASQLVSKGNRSVPWLDDGTVDMWSSFDLFDVCSNHDCDDRLVPPEHLRMRDFLRRSMVSRGFRPLADEWWHYTLENEPFPETYFDF